ncbi:MAG: glycoside hydrolase family 2 TIM barrel-domain containing protein [bacterium]
MRFKTYGIFRHGPKFPALALVAAVLALLPVPAATAAPVTPVRVVVDATDPGGLKLEVEGRDFMVFGMNWGYMPIGENHMYNLWDQPDEFIEEVLSREMPLLKNMGVNAIRQYAGIPPRWVRHIYERYGIYTVVNHLVARYGYTLDGVWMPSVDYSDPRLRQVLIEEASALVEEFDGVPGVLMWLLGNENNYGLTWTSFEIQALPEGEREAARARYLYSLYEEITVAIKERDPHRPVAISNGDIQYIDIIAEECRNLDVLGTNVYRGISARDLFQVVHDKLGIPVMFTEFGADAWNAREMREDQITQARYLLGQWQEIYEQSSGKGRVGNAIGGFIFQWSDGWWKFLQDERLDIHDTNASWPNGGYVEDYVEGENNMNEEWWGITAKGPPDFTGQYAVYPRAAFYALRRAFQLDPYAPETDLETIREEFGEIDPVVAELEARGDEASRLANAISRVRVSNVRAEFETYNTGGTNIVTPEAGEVQEGDVLVGLPLYLGFGHQQSFYVDFEVQPSQNFNGLLSLNILGNVGMNQIDEIFYENRGVPRLLWSAGDNFRLQDGEFTLVRGIERVKVYQGGVSWDDRWFRLEGFYRTGHYHWGYEGDFFGIYREAFYGENIDIYNADAPIGAELIGKKHFEGFKLAFGPQLWWGANPSLFLKYQKTFGDYEVAGLFQEEFAQQTEITSSGAIPLPPTRRASLYLKTRQGPVDIEVGGLWAGSTKEGEEFQIYEGTPDNYRILVDKVRASDAFGAKAKVAVERGYWHWYAQAAYAGIVADGGPTATTTYTGWTLKDSNAGNQTNFLTGLAVDVGNFQIAPNFLWQKPIVGPVPGFVNPPGRPRNTFDDPFAVRANRETVGGELTITYDPTPATWMWAWDNDVREDARLALSMGFVFRHQPTTADAALAFCQDEGSQNLFICSLGGAPPAKDLWEVRSRLVSRLSARSRLVAHVYFGTAEPNGWDYAPDDPDSVRTRFINRFGADARLTWGPAAFEAFARFNDWGPYDYHRDWNFTFPVHLMGDVSYSLGEPRWFGWSQTRIGLRGLWRSLDQYSNRYEPGAGSTDDGSEWEIRTYMHISL